MISSLFAVTLVALSVTQPPDIEFRAQMEARKDRMLTQRADVSHPVLTTPAMLDQARRNIATADWARAWLDSEKALADWLVQQPPEYVDAMLSETSPWHHYGFTCPRCVGVKTQEGAGGGLFTWDYKDPDVITCRFCKQTYPSPDYPETGRITCPRTRQEFTFYLNEKERAQPEDTSGRLAYHWTDHPIHVSFSGIIRYQKAAFMLNAVDSLANAYAFTGDSRYATAGIRILTRAAACYRAWLYRDYWDTVADCDPLYAAWHGQRLPRDWKKHLCDQAFRKDSDTSAAMLQTYWGAGRYWPSTDSIGCAVNLCRAYDLLHDARDPAGNPMWSDAARAVVERDLLMEWVMGAEPYVGGEGKADLADNKTPRIYEAFAVIGKCLGLPEWVEVAFRGYEGLRDRSFLYDGFSTESPSYTCMYLRSLVGLTEALHGCRRPETYAAPEGTIDLYSQGKLRMMLTAIMEAVDGDGRLLPLSDTHAGARVGREIVEVAMRRYPERFNGMYAAYCPGSPSSYALFNLDAAALQSNRPLHVPEQVFPAWMTATLRHGCATAALAFNPPGGHRHLDNLALYYGAGPSVCLEDLGYVGDMPVNKWIRTTESHNLVVVDNSPQRSKRTPSLSLYVSAPLFSAVEATSDAYAQCTEYRRLCVLLKGPAQQTVLLDIFRVKGGQTHAYRLHSAHAASFAKDGALHFSGITMPPEAPLPDVGASLEYDDIFGLRDVRRCDAPAAPWQATWADEAGKYRLWMLSAADAVEAANGPAQLDRQEPGRRARYLDVLRHGAPAESTFVALHEPATADGTLPVTAARCLPIPPEAGPNAVAVEITCGWGIYTILSEFAQPQAIDGIEFAGTLHVRLKTKTGEEASASLRGGGLASEAARGSDHTIHTPTPLNSGDTRAPAAYLLVDDGARWTGFPISDIKASDITVSRFNLPPEVRACRLPEYVENGKVEFCDAGIKTGGGEQTTK